MGQKRGRDSKVQAQQSKKRKANKAEALSDDGAWDGIVGIDELNWKEVALPDRMEDVGGFFGLEEIDDVDIIRPQGNGQVQFKVRQCIPMFEASMLLTYAQIENRQNLASLKILF